MRTRSLSYILLVGVVPLACITPPDVTDTMFGGVTGDMSGSSTTTGMMVTTVPADSSTGEVTTSTTTTGMDSTSTGDAESSSSSEDDDNGGGQLCGNGEIEGTEDCDCGGGSCTPEGLGNLTCAEVEDPLVPGVLTGGILGCNPASCKFDTALCTYCGDGEVNGIETCEPDTPVTETCQSLGMGSAGDLFCGDVCQINTDACTACGAVFEFTTCAGDWFPLQAHGSSQAVSWECGDPVAGVGPGVGETGVWGTSLAGDYADFESSSLISPPIDLSNCTEPTVELRVHHWFQFETVGPVANDGGIVQVSDNIVSNWQTITPISGVLYDDDPLGTEFTPPGSALGFSGTTEGVGMWGDSVFDLTPFVDYPELYVRFVVGSDDSGTEAGWYVDRVEVVGIN